MRCRSLCTSHTIVTCLSWQHEHETLDRAYMLLIVGTTSRVLPLMPQVTVDRLCTSKTFCRKASKRIVHTLCAIIMALTMRHERAPGGMHIFQGGVMSVENRISSSTIQGVMHLGLRRRQGQVKVRGYPRARGQVAPAVHSALYAAPAIALGRASTPLL